MQPSQPSAFDDLKTLAQVSFVRDGKVIVVARKDQPTQSLNIPVGGHADSLDLALPPARELREEGNNWYKFLMTGKP